MAKTSNLKYALGSAIVVIVIAGVYLLSSNASNKLPYQTSVSSSVYTTLVSSSITVSTASQKTTSVSTSIESAPTTLATTIPNGGSCGYLEVSVPTLNSSISENCTWSGGNLTISRSTGETDLLGYTITAHYSNNSQEKTVQSSYLIPSNSTCKVTLASEYYRAGSYSLEVKTYSSAQNDTCGTAFVKFTAS